MNVKQIVEFCFRHEECILRAVMEKRLDTGNTTTGDGGGHCKMSDPTAQQAIHNVSDVACVEVEYGPATDGVRAVMPLRRPLQWLKVARWTREYYDGKPQGDMIRMKYKESLLRDDICRALKISTASYYVALADIFTYAAGLAKGLGLTKV